MSRRLSDLQGQVALITGGAGGLGSETANWLAAAGAQVVIADVSTEGLERAAAGCADSVPDAKPVETLVLDVTNSAAVRAAVVGIEDRHGRLDILVTSHGFPRDHRLTELTDVEWSDVINVCLTGTFFCIREAARLMTAQGYGRIVTLASRAWQGNPGQANYSAAKAGVVGLTKSVAKELGRKGVTANAIAPGLIETASLRNLETFEAIAERAVKANSIKRLGEPSDIAAAVLYLTSPEAGFLTGEVVHVSGGRFS
ncbi:SDR family NAD(P)-dependent oxidoreductase [Streptomyces sp. NPDC056656]|uniref:SDR family NAD(P)-dependent oxidoreductase n=1 Tax=Streptomyces sp. NPDC056656 TaxID=3345895 RepID=UPI0036938C21